MAVPRIVVVGGGFAGLYAATYLARSDLGRDGADVLLVDRKNFFTFTPLLAEVAAGTLGREHVTYSFRTMALRHGFRYKRGTVGEVDRERRVVRTDREELPYDYLVLAVGASPSFFGNEEVRRGSLPFVSVEDALALRARVIHRMEEAGRAKDDETRARCLSFVVAGGGPAGVEVASEIQRLGSEVLRPYFPGVPLPRMVLATAGDRILEGFDRALADRGLGILREMGMEVLLNTRVEGREPGRVRLLGPEGPTEVAADTLIWTAGTSPPDWLADLGLPTERGGLKVDRHLRVEGESRIFAVGDSCHLINERTDRPFPPVAPIAISQGVRAAANIEATVRDQPLEPYHAHHAGKIVSLGGGVALMDLLGYHVGGRPAWWLYRAAYLAKLVGTKNKVRLVVTLLLNRVFEPDLTFPEDLVADGARSE